MSTTEPQPAGTTQGAQTTQTVNPDQVQTDVTSQLAPAGVPGEQQAPVGESVPPTTTTDQGPTPTDVQTDIPSSPSSDQPAPEPDAAPADQTAGTDYQPTTIAGVDPSMSAAEAQAAVDERARLALTGDIANTDPIPLADPEADCTCATLPDNEMGGDMRCPVHGQFVAGRIEGLAARDARLSPLRDYLPRLDGVLFKIPADDPIYATDTAPVAA